MLTVSELNLLVEKRVVGVEISGLPCLASGRSSRLTSDYIADLRRQGIAVDDKNDPTPLKILDEVPNLGEGFIWIPEEII